MNRSRLSDIFTISAVVASSLSAGFYTASAVQDQKEKQYTNDISRLETLQKTGENREVLKNKIAEFKSEAAVAKAGNEQCSNAAHVLIGVAAASSLAAVALGLRKKTAKPA